MLRAALPGRPLQNRTTVQWDIGALLKRDGAADESVYLQSVTTSIEYVSRAGKLRTLAVRLSRPR
jgi:hypothetical protein